MRPIEENVMKTYLVTAEIEMEIEADSVVEAEDLAYADLNPLIVSIIGVKEIV